MVKFMIKKIPSLEEVMIRDVACAKLPGTRDDVLDILKDRNVSGVPVIKEGKLVGMVSRTNILKNSEEEHLALLMSRNPFTIKYNSSLIDASEILYENKIRRLPVIDENGYLKGLITTADIINVISDLDIMETIEEYIKSKVYTVWEKTPVSIVSYQMDLVNVKACPVINDSLNLVGMISDRDIVEYSIIEDSVQKSDMSSGIDEDIWTWESLRNRLNIYYSVSKLILPENILAKDIMIKDIIYATSLSNVSDCARKMKRYKIDQIPIIDSNYKLKGILRDQDLLKIIVKMKYY